MKEVCRLDDLIALLTSQLNGGLKGFLRFDCVLINIHLFVFLLSWEQHRSRQRHIQREYPNEKIRQCGRFRY